MSADKEEFEKKKKKAIEDIRLRFPILAAIEKAHASSPILAMLEKMPKIEPMIAMPPRTTDQSTTIRILQQKIEEYEIAIAKQEAVIEDLKKAIAELLDKKKMDHFR